MKDITLKKGDSLEILAKQIEENASIKMVVKVRNDHKSKLYRHPEHTAFNEGTLWELKMTLTQSNVFLTGEKDNNVWVLYHE